jgi:hypothetical protein
MAEDWIRYWDIEKWETDFNDDDIVSKQYYPKQIDYYG